MSGTGLLGRNDIKRLLEENGLSPRKSLGQNFVVDPMMIDRIVRLANIGSSDRVVEIGAGLGSLTLGLKATGAQVVAFEIDPGLAAVARKVLGESVVLIEQDALTADIADVLGSVPFRSEVTPSADGVSPPWILVANLPYNVATPLVLSVLETVPAVERMLVMVQREVGERFVATPSGKTFGAVSVRISYFASARIAAKVPREVFYPQPRVDSVLVEIVRRSQYAVDPRQCSYPEIVSLVRSGFSQRRKMLRRSLSGLVSEESFACAQLDPTLRAENLDVVAWGKLAGCQRTIANSHTPS